jgi:hypothetical protein
MSQRQRHLTRATQVLRHSIKSFLTRPLIPISTKLSLSDPGRKRLVNLSDPRRGRPLLSTSRTGPPRWMAFLRQIRVNFGSTFGRLIIFIHVQCSAACKGKGSILITASPLCHPGFLNASMFHVYDFSMPVYFYFTDCNHMCTMYLHLYFILL